jgi:hypothetical protein
LPTEKHREYICGKMSATGSEALSLEFADTDAAENEGIREVIVGPKKKVSSSG